MTTQKQTAEQKGLPITSDLSTNHDTPNGITDSTDEIDSLPPSPLIQQEEANKATEKQKGKHKP